MNNFLIGQHGGFNEVKQQRDFRKGFYGVQACLFENEEDIEKLFSEAKINGFRLAVHFPLRTGVFQFRDPLFLSLNDKTRTEAFKLADKEFQYMSKIKPSYVLFHYPKPVILDDTVDWSQWRFADSSEYIFESDYSIEELKVKSEYLFDWLSRKSEEYEFTPVLELDALNKYIYKTTLLEELLTRYPKIKLCLDTGRLHIQSRIDANFNAEEIIERFARYTHVVHLWNAKVTDITQFNHHPVLQELNMEEGWADIESYLRLIIKENKNCLFMFEHRSELLTDEQLEACYAWVGEVLSS